MKAEPAAELQPEEGPQEEQDEVDERDAHSAPKVVCTWAKDKAGNYIPRMREIKNQQPAPEPAESFEAGGKGTKGKKGKGHGHASWASGGDSEPRLNYI